MEVYKGVDALFVALLSGSLLKDLEIQLGYWNLKACILSSSKSLVIEEGVLILRLDLFVYMSLMRVRVVQRQVL